MDWVAQADRENIKVINNRILYHVLIQLNIKLMEYITKPYTFALEYLLNTYKLANEKGLYDAIKLQTQTLLGQLKELPQYMKSYVVRMTNIIKKTA